MLDQLGHHGGREEAGNDDTVVVSLVSVRAVVAAALVHLRHPLGSHPAQLDVNVGRGEPAQVAVAVFASERKRRAINSSPHYIKLNIALIAKKSYNANPCIVDLD